MRLLSQNNEGRCVYLVPREALAEIVYADWSNKFGSTLGVKVVYLTGETGADLKACDRGYTKLLRGTFLVF